ncbi:hypothetical protein IWQ56_007369, partial [Coemansia nantahalensis]
APRRARRGLGVRRHAAGAQRREARLFVRLAHRAVACRRAHAAADPQRHLRVDPGALPVLPHAPELAELYQAQPVAQQGLYEDQARRGAPRQGLVLDLHAGLRVVPERGPLQAHPQPLGARRARRGRRNGRLQGRRHAGHRAHNAGQRLRRREEARAEVGEEDGARHPLGQVAEALAQRPAKGQLGAALPEHRRRHRRRCSRRPRPRVHGPLRDRACRHAAGPRDVQEDARVQLAEPRQRRAR